MSETKKQWVTPSAFAKIMGVTAAAVTKAMDTGRLDGAVMVTESGLRKIEADLGKRFWVMNTKPNNTSVVTKKVRERDEAIENPEPDAEPSGLHEAKRRREFALAQIAEIELEEKLGKLLRVEQVRKICFEATRIARDALLNIPNRVSDELTGMTDRDAIHALLTKQIFEAMQEMEKLNDVGVDENSS